MEVCLLARQKYKSRLRAAAERQRSRPERAQGDVEGSQTWIGKPEEAGSKLSDKVRFRDRYVLSKGTFDGDQPDPEPCLVRAEIAPWRESMFSAPDDEEHMLEVKVRSRDKLRERKVGPR